MPAPIDVADGSEAGFTLVELLVALALMAVITAHLSGAFSTLRRAGALTDGIEDSATVEAVATHVRRALEAAVPVLRAGEDGRHVLAFEGEPERIRYVTLSDGRLEAGGLVEVEIGLEAGSGTAGPALRETRQAYRGPGREASATRHLLLEDAGLRLRYYGASGSAEAPAWHERWERHDALPLAVEISLARIGARRPAPSLNVALPAAR